MDPPQIPTLHLYWGEMHQNNIINNKIRVILLIILLE